jgi:hypothetical protein
MPERLPAVEVPIVLTVDPASLVEASRQLTDMVMHAVRAGYSHAVADVDFEAEESGAYENPPARLREVLAEFAEANEELLRRLGTAVVTGSTKTVAGR